MSKKEKVKLLKDDADQIKRLEENEREQAEEDAFRQGKDALHMILEPKYTKDPRLKVDREAAPPSEHLYIGLGWDEDRHTICCGVIDAWGGMGRHRSALA